jgi:hypothetical protein
MRILDYDTNKSVKDLLILLTPEEVMELIDDLEQLVSQDRSQNHVHLNDSDFQREITIAIYKPDDFHSFDDRIKQLILEN